MPNTALEIEKYIDINTDLTQNPVDEQSVLND